jgi:nickel/cobalt transporter (NiCoT) family protein
VSAININTLGYIIVGMFVLTWTAALTIWRLGHIEERWKSDVGETN